MSDTYGGETSGLHASHLWASWRFRLVAEMPYVYHRVRARARRPRGYDSYTPVPHIVGVERSEVDSAIVRRRRVGTMPVESVSRL